MKYTNIIFDYGNVLGSFDPNYMLMQFCETEEECRTLYDIVYENWQAIDDGSMAYDVCVEQALSKTPEHLQEIVARFFKEWHLHLPALPQMRAFAHELKQQNIPVYLLSNASVHFAEHAMEVCPVLEEFDGILFSGPVACAKPDPVIYQMLFDQFDLNPKECFFIDDNADNIEAGRKLGMDGIVFTGDLDAVKQALSDE